MILQLSASYTDPIPSNSPPLEPQMLVPSGEYIKTYCEQGGNGLTWTMLLQRCICVMIGLGYSSIDRYVRALAVCNSLAELASRGGGAEFVDRLSVLMTLKKHWMQGHADAKVVCCSDEVEGETGDETVDIQNIGLENILSHDSLTESQRVLVLCGQVAASDGTGSDNLHQQTESYSLLPSLLTVPSTHSSEFIFIIYVILSTQIR